MTEPTRREAGERDAMWDAPHCTCPPGDPQIDCPMIEWLEQWHTSDERPATARDRTEPGERTCGKVVQPLRANCMREPGHDGKCSPVRRVQEEGERERAFDGFSRREIVASYRAAVEYAKGNYPHNGCLSIDSRIAELALAALLAPSVPGEREALRERRYFPGGDPERASCCPHCHEQLSPGSIRMLATSEAAFTDWLRWLARRSDTGEQEGEG